MTNPAYRNGTAAADARIDARHPFAAHLRRAAAAERAHAHQLWTPERRPAAEPVPQPRRPDAVRDGRLDDRAALLGAGSCPSRGPS